MIVCGFVEKPMLKKSDGSTVRYSLVYKCVAPLHGILIKVEGNLKKR